MTKETFEVPRDLGDTLYAINRPNTVERSPNQWLIAVMLFICLLAPLHRLTSNKNEIVLEKKPCRDVHMTQRDHLAVKKLGVKGPPNLCSKKPLPWDIFEKSLHKLGGP